MVVMDLLELMETIKPMKLIELKLRVWVGGFLCKVDKEPHLFLNISDKNGGSKLNKLTILGQKWNFWNLMAKFDK